MAMTISIRFPELRTRLFRRCIQIVQCSLEDNALSVFLIIENDFPKDLS